MPIKRGKKKEDEKSSKVKDKKKLGRDKSSKKEDKKSSSKDKKSSSLRDRVKDKVKESKKKGFTAMREAKKEYSGGNRKWMNFWVGKGETKPVIFLTDDLYTVRAHNVKQMSRGGKEYFAEYLCTEDDDCKLCAEAKAGNKAISTPRTTGIVLVLDVEGYEKDNKEYPYIIRPMTVNPTMSSVLEHRDNKEGLYLTVYDMSKLDRGHSLDVVRDDDDQIQRFEDVEDLIDYIKDDNEDTAKLLEEKLEEFGDIGSWLREEVVPEFLDPENANIAESSDEDKEDKEEKSYKFGSGRRGRDRDKKSDKKRSRLR